MFSYWHHFGGITVRRSVIAGALLTAGIAAAASLVASTPATADPIYQGHFHDVFTAAPYDCEGTPARPARPRPRPSPAQRVPAMG